jgi:hypothetical protein
MYKFSVFRQQLQYRNNFHTYERLLHETSITFQFRLLAQFKQDTTIRIAFFHTPPCDTKTEFLALLISAWVLIENILYQSSSTRFNHHPDTPP